MLMLRIKTENGGQEIMFLGVIRQICYINLKYKKYDTWNIKVD